MKTIFLAGYRDGNHWSPIGAFPSSEEAQEALRTVRIGDEVVAVAGEVVECPSYANLQAYKLVVNPVTEEKAEEGN